MMIKVILELKLSLLMNQKHLSYSVRRFLNYQEELSTGEISRSEFDKIVDNAWRKGEWYNGDWARYTVKKYKLSDYSELDEEYLEAMKD